MDRLIYEILPALRMVYSGEKVCSVRYYENTDACAQVRKYNTGNSRIGILENALYLDAPNDKDEIIGLLKPEMKDIKTRRCVFIENKGVLLIAESPAACTLLIDALAALLNSNIELSNKIYQTVLSVPPPSVHDLSMKVAVVTGGAMGFGEGIVRDLFGNGVNTVIADVNRSSGMALADELNALPDHSNKALFVECDISVEKSVQELTWQTVQRFGGLDVMISNAGILRAGGLDEMDFETFQLTTTINYSGYFLCAKYSSEIMKIQHENAPDYFMDIIQINSKSGLRGSNRNFAYAGGKFGGIGLTQSFALELMPYKIKVNSICPGNYFEGPLWSDPTTGLFVQYLNAGKVPHAKTIADVKKHYENLIPAKRGCTVKDVMKAIYYIIDQEYETGQAVPVTGGQIMLN